MKSILIGLCLMVGVLAAVVYFGGQGSQASARPVTSLESNPSVVIASPGRVEGHSRTIAVGAAIDGIVESIRVREGQRVTKGQILGEIGCSDLRSSLEVARSESDAMNHARTRLVQGSRPEERQMAAQKTAAARSVLQQSAQNWDRYEKLWDAQATSKAAFEEARRDYEVATAKLQEAIRNEELVNAGPVQEDVARADADVQAAASRVALAQDRLSKCQVRAPLDGTVLRVNLREGESFALLSPKPLFTLADISARRIRAEIDERDIARVRIGQHARITSDAFSDARFTGVVREISSIMGRKAIATGDPTEKSDRDVLEVVLDLDGSTPLPLGLRVTVQFLR